MLSRWLVFQAILWPAVLVHEATGSGAEGPRVFLIALILSFCSLWILARCGRFVADYATLLRFCLLVGLSVTLRHLTAPAWGWWAIAVTAISADLLDGFLARRFGGSDAGAVLDMETDQLGTMILALALMKLTAVSWWVLLLPGYKYVFALAILLAGRAAHDPKPKAGNNNRGRYVHLFVMISLLVGLAPVTPDGLRVVLAGASVILLGWSFGDDALWILYGSRKAERASLS